MDGIKTKPAEKKKKEEDKKDDVDPTQYTNNRKQ
jgi:hypothetical protein